MSAERLGTVLLENHLTSKTRIYCSFAPSHQRSFVAEATHFMSVLKRFSDEFSEIATFWKDKLGASATEGFWDSVVRGIPSERRKVLKVTHANFTISTPQLDATSLEYETPQPSAKRHSGADANLPSDFDPDLYLYRNPDVAAAGMEAADHYINFGRDEGRVWK